MAESPARTAFAEEALTHLDTLYRGALRLTRDPDQAQDLVQEAYVRALRYQHSYQPGTNMKAWLFAIMRNLFWDRFKGGRQEEVSLPVFLANRFGRVYDGARSAPVSPVGADKPRLEAVA